MSSTEFFIGKRTIELSHEDKILFPKSRITKGELIDYYAMIAPLMVPLIADHPIAMQRYPDGITGEGFYQKDRGDYFPDWIKYAAIARLAKDKVTNYVICNDAATLIYLANQAAITIHTWLSSFEKKNYPDRMVFDIDPPNTQAWPSVKTLAKHLKIILESYGLTPFVMTTGSKGLHVVVPLKQKQTFKQIYLFAQAIAQKCAQQHPELITLNMRKEQRTNKIFIDILRNRWAQLTVAPYSVRAQEGAPIATPLHWRELDTTTIKPQRYNIKNIKQRLARIADPWHDFYSKAGVIPTKR